MREYINTSSVMHSHVQADGKIRLDGAGEDLRRLPRGIETTQRTFGCSSHRGPSRTGHPAQCTCWDNSSPGCEAQRSLTVWAWLCLQCRELKISTLKHWSHCRGSGRKNVRSKRTFADISLGLRSARTRIHHAPQGCRLRKSTFTTRQTGLTLT